jgi:glycosyltransferase involved in cell wall biosynthesis
MMLDRLKADGHDVAVLGLYGNQAGMEFYDTPHGPVPLYPVGAIHYGLDVCDQQAKHWFNGEPGVVITLFDVWVLGGKNAPRFEGLPVASWTPIDHDPVPPDVHKWAKAHKTIAMSRFGQEALAAVGVKSAYIPHGLGAEWKHTPSDIRQRMSVPEDAFLVTMNAANIGTPNLDRKAWIQNLRAFSLFARNHDDVLLYLHTDPTRPDGFPIPAYLHYLGLPGDRMRLTDLFAYRSGLIPTSEMVELYSATDVLLAASSGEGFGLPVAESMLCGTPAIVTDFSAQPEIVGDTGWKIEYEPFWDKMQKSDVAMPSTAGIYEALEEAYAERGSIKAVERSIAAEERARAEYDADTVYAEKWRPYLAGLEASLTEPPEEPHKPNRAERRAAKRAA